MSVAEPGSRTTLARLAPLVGVLLFAVALWLLHRELKSFHYRDVVRYLDSLPAADVLRAVCLTAIGYFTLTGYDVLAFRYLGRPLAYRRIALASFAGYAFSNSLGFPLLTGTPVRVRLYSGWGISALEVTRLMLFSYLTFWLGFLTLSGGAFLLDPVEAPESLHLRGMGARPLGALSLALAATYLLVLLLRRKPFTVRGFSIDLPPPRMALVQIGLGALDLSLAGAVLFLLLPEGAGPYFHFLGVFLLALLAGLLSNVPAGLGIFETVMVLLLPPEVPRPQLLAALVTYRAIYYFLPLLAAVLALGTHEAARRREQVGRLTRTVGDRAADLVPPVFAVATFACGALLLLSGATPSRPSRLATLGDLLPLPILEACHFLASLAGVALLFLAVGLQRRLAAAYRGAAVVLAAGVALALGRGLDWKEALVLALVLAALLPCRRDFDRAGPPAARPIPAGWAAAIAMTLLGVVWLGLFSFKQTGYSHDLWWRFTLAGDAPRFLRAAAGAAGLAVLLALRRLLRRRPEDQPPAVQAPREDQPPAVQAPREDQPPAVQAPRGQP